MNWGYKPYVPVAKRRAQAAKAAQKAAKTGAVWSPIQITGRTIAHTFWGKAWCSHLEGYSDFENRLPRGRTYARNGSVVDLQILPGKVLARVMGSELYQVEINITALAAAPWQSLVQDCTGTIASLVELLQGRLSQATMQRLCDAKTGMFPAPKEIRMRCSCPDWAGMCKHLAATLYGVGARLDAQPELLFTLRQVNAQDLLSAPAIIAPKAAKKPSAKKLLDASALADVFGLDLAEPAPTQAPTQAAPAAAKKPRASAKKAPTPIAASAKAAAKKPAAKKTAAKKTPAKKAAVKKTAAPKSSK